MILGIDPSANGTALCFMREHSPLYEVELLTPPGKMAGMERIGFLYASVRDAVARERPRLCVVEDYSFNSKGQQHLAGEVGGAIRLALFHAKIPTMTITPMGLKKFTCATATDIKKEQMLLHAYKRWGVEFSSNDCCDAYCLARAGRAYLGLDAVAGARSEAIAKMHSLMFMPRRRSRNF